MKLKKVALPRSESQSAEKNKNSESPFSNHSLDKNSGGNKEQNLEVESEN